MKTLALLLSLLPAASLAQHAPPLCAQVTENVSFVRLLTASCQNGTPATLGNTHTSGIPAAACITTGTDLVKGVLDFDSTNDEGVQSLVTLPSDWIPPIDVEYRWLSGTGSTNPVVWCTQLVCVADGEEDTAGYPGQSTSSCVSDAGKGTANQMNLATDTTVAAVGCAAGELMRVRVSRDPDETSTLTDTHAADARLISVTLKLRREL